MPLTLANAIKRLLNVWVSCAIFLILIILLQTIFGKFGSDADAAWGWLAMHLLPGLALLLIGYLRHKKLADFALPKAAAILYNIVFFVSIAYLAAVILSLLTQPFGTDQTEIANLQRTNTGLFFFQGIFLILMAILIYKTERLFIAAANGDDEEFVGELAVFISYNHQSKNTAFAIKEMLEKEAIPVIIDATAMLAGESIDRFIQRSVKKASTVIFIVSKQSLMSGWVGTEVIDTLFLGKYLTNKKFIAGYLDDGCFQPDFTAQAVIALDEELKKIKRQAAQHNKLGIDTRDLNDQRSRLIALRNNFDHIINRLQSSLCIDVRDEKLPETFPLLLKSIRSV